MSRFIKPLIKWEAIIFWKIYRWFIIPSFSLIAVLLLLSALPVDLYGNNGIYILNSVVALGAVILGVVLPLYFTQPNNKQAIMRRLDGCPYLLELVVKTVYSCFAVMIGIIALVFHAVIAYVFDLYFDTLFYTIFGVNIFERIPWFFFVAAIYICGMLLPSTLLTIDAFMNKHKNLAVQFLFGIGWTVFAGVCLPICGFLIEAGGIYVVIGIVLALAMFFIASVIGSRYVDNKIDLTGGVKL